MPFSRLPSFSHINQSILEAYFLLFFLLGTQTNENETSNGKTKTHKTRRKEEELKKKRKNVKSHKNFIVQL